MKKNEPFSVYKELKISGIYYSLLRFGNVVSFYYLGTKQNHSDSHVSLVAITDGTYAYISSYAPCSLDKYLRNAYSVDTIAHNNMEEKLKLVWIKLCSQLIDEQMSD